MFSKEDCNIIDGPKQLMSLFSEGINDGQISLFRLELDEDSIQQEDQDHYKPECINPIKCSRIDEYEPGVRLVTEEEYAKLTETNYKQQITEDYQPSLFEASIYSSKYSDVNDTEIKINQYKIKDYILKVCHKLIEKQKKVDDGTFKRKGPGRRRQNTEKTSSQFNFMIKKYLRDKFIWLSKNKKGRKRMDAVITFYLRALKKGAYFFVEKAAAKNMYKRRDPMEFSVAFSESFIAFISSIKSIGKKELVELFGEFIVIYFPADKGTKLLDSLIDQKDLRREFLEGQKVNLKFRDVTSKRNIKRWASTSRIFNNLLKLSFEVLNEQKLVRMNNGILNHLNKIAKDVIYE